MKGRKILPHSALRNFFGDRLIYEARADLAVVPIAADIKNALKNNPTECVFAQACKRAYGSSIAVFFRHVAYIELIDPRTDKPHITRFKIGDLARHAIEAFDKGRGAKPGAFILSAPPTCYTLAAKEAHTKNRDRDRAAKPVRKQRAPQIQHRGRVSTLTKMGLAS